jgi:hypothetical protein
MPVFLVVVGLGLAFYIVCFVAMNRDHKRRRSGSARVRKVRGGSVVRMQAPKSSAVSGEVAPPAKTAKVFVADRSSDAVGYPADVSTRARSGSRRLAGG